MELFVIILKILFLFFLLSCVVFLNILFYQKTFKRNFHFFLKALFEPKNIDYFAVWTTPSCSLFDTAKFFFVSVRYKYCYVWVKSFVQSSSKYTDILIVWTFVHYTLKIHLDEYFFTFEYMPIFLWVDNVNISCLNC